MQEQANETVSNFCREVEVLEEARSEDRVKNDELKQKLEAQAQLVEGLEEALEWQRRDSELEQLRPIAREREK